MKKAVITAGGKQYLVTEGQTLEVDLVKNEGKTASFAPLLVIDGETVSVGTPEVSDSKVIADIVEQRVQGDKTVAIRYKSKKRVHKVRGHRQLHTVLKITKIS
jgi:large subunit ribosomal protein L21